MLNKLAGLPSLSRAVVLIFLSILLVWLGFKRETKLLIVEQGVPVFINRYPKPKVAEFENKDMKGTLGIKIPVKLQSAALFSFLFMISGSLLLLVYARSVFIGKLWAVVNVLYMLVCITLLKLGGLGVDYRLSTGLSHYLEDLFLSPFLILAMAALLRALGFTSKQRNIE